MAFRTITGALSAGVALLLCMPQGVAQPHRCQPALALKDARISDVKDQQRTWTALLIADASRCSTSSGTVEIQFTRLKETAPDLRFSERFTWYAPQSEVALDMWWDEWLQDYQIRAIEPCPCRG